MRNNNKSQMINPIERCYYCKQMNPEICKPFVLPASKKYFVENFERCFSEIVCVDVRTGIAGWYCSVDNTTCRKVLLGM